MSLASLFSRSLVATLCLSSAAVHALSIPTSLSDLIERDSCTNGPSSRGCWSDGFDIDTNYYDSWPEGKLVTYDFTITETQCSPDGNSAKLCQLINGQMPGPTIEADWGDTVQVTVHNNLPINGTSIHWHGIRQLNSCEMDGVNGVTECPIAPGTSKTYTWIASQYGTSWYHSHHTIQYGEGILGPMIINGPSTANYDEDLGVLTLQDWFYESVYELLTGVMTIPGPPPSSQNVLVAGKMIDGKGNGEYERLSVESGKSYLLRLVNTAVDHDFHVSLDGHPFTVVSADFNPIVPYQTTDLEISIGQRYEIIFEANQDIANYWLRLRAATPSLGCGFSDIFNNTEVVVGAIIQYDGAETEDLPTSTAYPYSPDCEGETIVNYLDTPMKGGYGSNLQVLNITEGFDGLVYWKINGSTFKVDWADPTLADIADGQEFSPEMNVLEMPEKDTWYLWVIENALIPLIPHPIHLHGHDFEVLGSGVGAFPWGTSFENVPNPPRRDVTMLPAGGWLLLGIYTDNPGAWLMHCHIAWHASQGLSLQFVERKSEIIDSIGSLADMNAGCAAWKGAETVMPDSGI